MNNITITTHHSAFWISNAGLIYPVATSHIRFVIDNADLFDMSKDDIKVLYATHNEKIGFEGKARKEIMSELISNGWIRTRYKESNNENFWTLELNELTESSIQNILKWKEMLLSLNQDLRNNLNTTVKIITLKNNKEIKVSLDELSSLRLA
ncbi:MAG: hypothetical protein NTW25_03770 [Candidatus Kapabacteria bacterium]|nr:hypothetical protein [Candidatus Kapabacteria bacterium]